MWLGVTAHPSAEWIARQLTEACGWSEQPRYVIRDRDGAYGDAFIRRVTAMGIRDRPISAVEWVTTDGGRCRFCTIFSLILVFDWCLRAGPLEEGFALVVVAVRP